MWKVRNISYKGKNFTHMKKIIAFSLFLYVFMVGCEEDAARGPNELGGEANIPLTKVGNSYSVSVTLGGTYLDINIDTAYISKNDIGVVTVKLKADISTVDSTLRS